MLRNIKRIITILGLFFISCQSSDKLELDIPEEKLIEIMVDIHYAEGATQNIHGKLKDSLVAVYYDEIYKIHGISEQDFQRNIRALRKNSKEVEAFYSKVLKRMDDIEAK